MRPRRVIRESESRVSWQEARRQVCGWRRAVCAARARALQTQGSGTAVRKPRWKGCLPVVMNAVFLEVEFFLKNSARLMVRAVVDGGAKEEHRVDVVNDAVRKGPEKMCGQLDCCRQKKHTVCRRSRVWLTAERWMFSMPKSSGGRGRRNCGARPLGERDGRRPVGRAVR